MPKISEQFRQILRNLPDSEPAQAIVMLQLAKPASGRRRTRIQRAAQAKQNRRTADESLIRVDQVLAAHGGRRLSPQASELGAISVAGSPNAILALESLSEVRTIMADQPIFASTTDDDPRVA